MTGWLSIEFLKLIITANASENQVQHIVVELCGISVSSKGAWGSLARCRSAALVAHTRLCLQSVVCYTSSMVVYKCALGNAVCIYACCACCSALFAFQIVSHEKLDCQHNVASRFSAVQWKRACFWNCLFASRVARHEKGTPPKIGGVKCLFFLLAKKMRSTLDADKDLRTVCQIVIDRSIPMVL